MVFLRHLRVKITIIIRINWAVKKRIFLALKKIIITPIIIIKLRQVL
jgi:hypothetical protein